ncbi:MAG: hypothetical protein AAB965_02480 [Patescibacteria group bacterium]
MPDPEPIQNPVPEVSEVRPITTTNLEPISVPPEQAVSSPEQAPEALPEAPEAPQSTPISAPAQTLVSTPEPQNQPPAIVSVPIEPAEPALASQPSPAAQPTAQAVGPNPRSFLAKALEKIQFRKRAKLEKIVKLATEKTLDHGGSGKKSITNDQVQKLLYVSDATASRYLLQLVKEGKLKKVGPDGRARYEPVSGSLPTN